MKYTVRYCFILVISILSTSVVASDGTIQLKVNDQLLDWGNDNQAWVGNSISVKRTITTGDDGLPVVSFKLQSVGIEDQTLELAIEVAPGFVLADDNDGGLGAEFFSGVDYFVASKGNVKILENALPIAPSQWVGKSDRSRVLAIAPLDLDFHAVVEDGTLQLEKILPVAGNDIVDLKFSLLTLPKTTNALAEQGLDQLLLVNLWGWFRWICLLLWSLMQILFEISGNWGVTILLLAGLIKIVTIPITRYALHYQELAVLQQQKIAPLLAEIKSQYTGVEQSEKIIAVYEQEQYEHSAPFKSLLAIGIQIPILIALFNILGNVSELTGVSFLWVEDLTVSDRLFNLGISVPYFGQYFNLLPFLLGLVTLASMLHTSTGWNLQRLSNGLLMGGLFFVLFYSFPAALVLYWLASNILQLIQQIVSQR